MSVGQRLTSLGDRLRDIALDFTHDINEANLIAHRALVRLIEHDPALTQTWRQEDLRRAIRLVAAPVTVRRACAAGFKRRAEGDWASPD